MTIRNVGYTDLGAAVRTCTLAVIILGGVVQAATIHVSTTGNDGGDGLTWATAKKTVQSGLNAAQPGDQAWVVAGMYDGTITLKTGVALYGGFAGTETDLASRDWKTNETILNGTQDDSVVISPQGATATTRIDGFTIQGGKGRLVGSAKYGGGIYCYNSSPTIANNKIIGNTGGNGGGICCGACSPVITNSVITGNNADAGDGIYCWYASPTIEHNVIADNGHDTLGEGGAILCLGDSSAKIVNNTIKGNKAYWGGGIVCENNASPIIINDTITDNTAELGGGVYCGSGSPTLASNTITGNRAESGGGIWCNASLSITNNVIAGNIARWGGGIYCYGGSTSIVNNTIAGNGSDWGEGGGIWCGGQTTISNTIIAFNSSGIYRYAWNISYTCVYGNTAYNFAEFPNPIGSNGNISVEPLLAHPPSSGPDGVWGTADDDYGDLHLQTGSPCINAGDPAYTPVPGGTDLDGQARVSYGLVDIGAFEWTLVGDINEDGSVDVVDLLVFVDAWASMKGDARYNLACDLTHDGSVDVVDLLTLAENWGKSI